MERLTKWFDDFWWSVWRKGWDFREQRIEPAIFPFFKWLAFNDWWALFFRAVLAAILWLGYIMLWQWLTSENDSPYVAQVVTYLLPIVLLMALIKICCQFAWYFGKRLGNEKADWDWPQMKKQYEERIKALEDRLAIEKNSGDFDDIVSLYEKQIKTLQDELAAVQKQNNVSTDDALHLLGLNGSEITQDVLKSRIRLLRRLHPDKSGAECAGIFQAVQKAAETIKKEKGWR